ncbi:MAG TPA: NADP-dependent oxidoreductase [Solirubrobacteraceae bacterium]|nr:NADP-dependent oxidoreductase [Solirubrobacteraceae bacterium]
MRAVGLAGPGAGLQQLELEVPEPRPDELLVRVIASSINPVDAYIVNGTYGTGELSYPVVPGRDFCGVVERGADGFEPGDRVLGCWTVPEFQLGSWAQYLSVPLQSAVARWPDVLSAQEAAALPLAAVTAQLAIDALAPNAGETVLIVGAGGAVGCYAVQLAARRGARVIATAKPEAEQRVRALGAAQTIDYRRDDLLAAARELCPGGVPVVFDIVNDKPELLALAELVPAGGRVASARFAADRRVLSGRGVTPINVIANGHGGAVLADVLAMAAAGALQVLVSDTRPLDALPDAVQEFERGSAGKIVIEVEPA